MGQLGVIEGFFGPKWSESSRKSYADFLSQFGGDFYIYAPKQDPFLRKKWRDPWPTEYIHELKNLTTIFQTQGIKFGVGFSPFGLGHELTENDLGELSEKIEILNQIGIDMLGLFFDDMPISDNLAKTQIKVLSAIKNIFHGKIVFCPSYYTPDPILDKVFGQRPENYLEEISTSLPLDVAIVWTGPKVISLELSTHHLQETKALLRRKPFLWENLYANDGPKNCKFLKLRPFSGRSKESCLHVEAFGLNMMNQAELSKIVYLSSKFVLDGENPDEAFLHSLKTLCTPSFATFIETHQKTFLNQGLDVLSHEEKSLFLEELGRFPDLAAKEITDWLKGVYLVGTECLTD
jgi:hyaluronoglucosaminidase